MMKTKVIAGYVGLSSEEDGIAKAQEFADELKRNLTKLGSTKVRTDVSGADSKFNIVLTCGKINHASLRYLGSKKFGIRVENVSVEPAQNSSVAIKVSTTFSRM